MSFIIFTDNPSIPFPRYQTKPMVDSQNVEYFKAVSEYFPESFSLLDLGTGAGNFLKQFPSELSCGLDGSTYYLNRGVGLWGLDDIVGQHLFCANIEKPFKVVAKHCMNYSYQRLLPKDEGKDAADKDDFTDPWCLCEPFQFDCITSWQTANYLTEEGLQGLVDNMGHHLIDDGQFHISIDLADKPDYSLKKPREWWTNFFEECGLVHDKILYHKLRGLFPRGLEGEEFVLTLKRREAVSE
jgi:hypothetical protein